MISGSGTDAYSLPPAIGGARPATSTAGRGNPRITTYQLPELPPPPENPPPPPDENPPDEPPELITNPPMLA